MPGRLTLCATPIGNLGDAPPRLAQALNDADLILAEDTRRSAVLLKNLGVDRPLRSYFAGNEARRSEELERALAAGQSVALITDAGTPSISDPGVSAVAVARRIAATVSVIPGPSAITAAVAVSGLPAERFVFEGFIPHKGQERQKRLQEINDEQRTIVLFVSPHHLVEDLEDLARLGPERKLCVARELTKVFEEIQWTTVGEALTEWSSRTPQGEFTLVLGGAPPADIDLDMATDMALRQIAAGGTLSAVVRSVATRAGVSRRLLYDLVLARSRGTNSER